MGMLNTLHDWGERVDNMSYTEADKILKWSFKNELLCVCGGMFDTEDVDNCYIALVKMFDALDKCAEREEEE